MVYSHAIRRLNPFMTYTLILLNTFIFILTFIIESQTMIPIITYSFALIPAVIVTGQNLHTLITSMFLHADFLHLLINMYFLYIFGSVVEREMNPIIYLGIYTIAGIIGGLGHVLIMYTLAAGINSAAPFIPTIGASGAIFGIMAAYAYLLPRRPISIYGDAGRAMAVWNFIFIYFILEVIQMFIAFGTGVAHGAHVFGFLGGFLFAYIYRALRVRYNRRKPGAVYDPYEYYV